MFGEGGFINGLFIKVQVGCGDLVKGVGDVFIIWV